MPDSKPSTFTEAWGKFQASVPTIHKDAQAQRNKYAKIESILTVVNPALAAAGLAVVQGSDDDETGFYVKTALYHGNELIALRRAKLTVHVPDPKKFNPLHQWGGAHTYQRRYELLAILNLAAGIEDIDGYLPEVEESPAPKQAQAKAPQKSEEPAITDPLLSEEQIKEIWDTQRSWNASDPKGFTAAVTAYRKHKKLGAKVGIASEIQTQSDWSWWQAEFETNFTDFKA